MSDAERTSLASVRDLVAVGHPLPFHVHDEFGRRLLALGQVIVSDTQMEMLFARGAWVDSETASLPISTRNLPPRPGLCFSYQRDARSASSSASGRTRTGQFIAGF